MIVKEMVDASIADPASGGIERSGVEPGLCLFLLGPDDMMRAGLELLLRRYGYAPAGIFSDRPELLAALAKRPDPLLILNPEYHPAGSVLEVADLISRFPECRLLLVTRLDEIIYGPRFFKAGVKGFLSVGATAPEFLRAIQTVAAGGIAVSARLQNHLNRAALSDRSPEIADLLTTREMELFLLYGKGYRNAEIAGLTNISIKTVDSYRQRIKQKLNLRNASEFTRLAIRYSNQS